MLVDAGRKFLDPLYHRHTGGGAVFGDSMDIDWITKDGVIVATGTNWPVEIRIYVPWGHEAVLRGAVVHELLECGTGFAGKAYRMSDGDKEIRAGLAEYLLPDAAAA